MKQTFGAAREWWDVEKDVKVKVSFGLRHRRSLSDPFCTNLGPKGKT